MSKPKPEDDSENVMASGCAMVICGSPFLACLVAGVTIVSLFFVFPRLKRWHACDWIQTPCTLETCELLQVGDGGTRSHDVSVAWIGATYRYAYDGKSYSCDRVDFISEDGWGGVQASLALEDDAREYVQSHPAGTETVCYVNPSDPTQAVLLPDRLPSLIGEIVPGTLILVGLIGFAVIVRASRKARRRRIAAARQCEST